MHQVLKLAAFAAVSFVASSNAQGPWGHGGHMPNGNAMPKGRPDGMQHGPGRPPGSWAGRWGLQWGSSTASTLAEESTSSVSSTSAHSSAEKASSTSTSVDISLPTTSTYGASVTTPTSTLSFSNTSIYSSDKTTGSASTSVATSLPTNPSSTVSVSTEASTPSAASTTWVLSSNETTGAASTPVDVSSPTSSASAVSLSSSSGTQSDTNSPHSSEVSKTSSTSAEVPSSSIPPIPKTTPVSSVPASEASGSVSTSTVVVPTSEQTSKASVSVVPQKVPAYSAASSSVIDYSTSVETTTTTDVATSSTTVVESDTTEVVFATVDVTVTSCLDTSTGSTALSISGSAPSSAGSASSTSLINGAASSSAFNEAWGSAQASYDESTSSSSVESSTTSSSESATQGSLTHSSSTKIFTQGLPSSLPPHQTPSDTASTEWTADSSPNSPGDTVTNEQQVGKSTWGTLDQPWFPQWLNGNGGPTYDKAPWGNRTTQDDDATVVGEVPVTNVTRHYNFTISRGRISADGVLRDVILINDQFPGPVIEANWGDNIQITVNNQIFMPDEGTTMHWHGMLMRATPWEDGVPSVGQCPIAPGHSLTYNYRAEIYGTTWYHSHYSAQMAGGISGPIIVHGPTQMDYDIDVGPVMLSDWYHIPYFAIVADAVGTNYSVIPPTSDSILINGRGRFNCSDPSYSSDSQWLTSNWASNITWSCVDKAPLSQFRFQSGKVHRLRLINHGANGVQKFSIDGHNLTVIATDFVPTVPYTTDVVTLGVGQRTDILVTATNYTKGAVWMRAELPGGEVCGGSDNPLTLAAIYYEDADTSVDPETETSLDNNSCVNDDLSLTVPEYSITPSSDVWTQDLSLTLALNDTGHFEFQINDIAYKADYNHPLLPQVADGNFTTRREWNVYNFHNNKSIILNITNNMPLTHPFHMHGHNFYVLNFGDNKTSQRNGTTKRAAGPTFDNGATWDGSVVNPSNPMRRDTLLIPSYGFAAIQFELNNPGLWPFHCHIAWHLSAGQVMNILYRPEDMNPIPSGYIAETCVDWDWYSAHNKVQQIDSGG